MKHSLKLVLLALLISVSTITEAKNKQHVKHVKHKHTQHHNQGSSSVGLASWYGYESTKRRKHRAPKTASGEIFNPSHMTAAHKSLPFGTKVLVTNLQNQRTVVVIINDRGPFIRGRIIDLSKAAAREIGMNGVAKVSLTIVGNK
jgi:rare lipoprotein A